MAFVEELKQRKVVRVAIAYLVVAWLGVQVASIALPAFEAPAWVLRVLILALALGFPLALVLAWAVDLTPQGPRWVPGGTGWKRLLAFSAALGVLAVGWYAYGQPAYRAREAAKATGAGPGDRPPAEATARTAALPAARSIAVLPFVNMSGDKGNDYFSDGLAETTLDMLAQVHDLKVIARTSSFAFKGKAQDVRAIGRALDAAHLLEGSVQQAGNTVRITAQLVRTRDGAHLWSHRYDRELTDVFAIQDEIAGEVVKALQLALPAPQQQRLTLHGTSNVAAYQEYLRGVALLPERRVADMRRGLVHLERATQLDAHYAGAHAAAAMALGLIDNYAGGSTPEEQARRRRHVDTALRLDPALGEAYAMLGALREEAGDYAAAEDNYRRATELSPNFATGWQWYGELLSIQLGEPERALRMLERALVLDPLSPVIRTEVARGLAETGDEAGALATLDALERDRPEYAAGHAARAEILAYRGDLVGALRAWDTMLARDPQARARAGGRCEFLLGFGARDDARRCIARIVARDGAIAAAAPRARLAMLDGDVAAFGRANRERRRPEPWSEIEWLVWAGRAKEAVARLQAIDPGMFIQPTPVLTSQYSADAVLAGWALLESGATAQGRDLLQRALKANAAHPIRRMRFGRGWHDAGVWALLGDEARACAAAREAVAAGLFTEIDDFTARPFMARLRGAPCFVRALAPARARAAAQVAAARSAGLL